MQLCVGDCNRDSVTPQVSDMQRRFDIAKSYKQHVNQVGEDRALEDYLQAESIRVELKFKDVDLGAFASL